MKPHMDESKPHAFTVVDSPVGRPQLVATHDGLAAILLDGDDP
jgi:hypothetical protein